MLKIMNLLNNVLNYICPQEFIFLIGYCYAHYFAILMLGKSKFKCKFQIYGTLLWCYGSPTKTGS